MNSSQACFLALDVVCSIGHTVTITCNCSCKWLPTCLWMLSKVLLRNQGKEVHMGGCHNVDMRRCNFCDRFIMLQLPLAFICMHPFRNVIPDAVSWQQAQHPLSLRCEFWQLQFAGALVMLSFLNAYRLKRPLALSAVDVPLGPICSAVLLQKYLLIWVAQLLPLNREVWKHFELNMDNTVLFFCVLSQSCCYAWHMSHQCIINVHVSQMHVMCNSTHRLILY